MTHRPSSLEQWMADVVDNGPIRLPGSRQGNGFASMLKSPAQQFAAELKPAKSEWDADWIRSKLKEESDSQDSWANRWQASLQKVQTGEFHPLQAIT